MHLEVRQIKHTLHTYEDLNFLIHPTWKPGDHLPKFVVFFDNIEESIMAAERLQRRLPESARDKIVWFNSRMTPEFWDEALDMFANGDMYGLFSTDSFGMVHTDTSQTLHSNPLW